MTDTQKKMIQRWTEADECGKTFLFDLVIVAVAIGEPFFDEMQRYVESEDIKAIRACIARYKALLREGATV